MQMHWESNLILLQVGQKCKLHFWPTYSKIKFDTEMVKKQIVVLDQLVLHCFQKWVYNFVIVILNAHNVFIWLNMFGL